MSDLNEGQELSGLSRRRVLGTALAAAGAATSVMQGPWGLVSAANPEPVVSNRGKRYEMKKSINLWAFPYPDKMSLEQFLRLAKAAGFDGIELNFDLESELSPKSGTAEFTAIRKLADQIGIAVSGLCSFLFWPYPLTSNDPQKRSRGLE